MKKTAFLIIFFICRVFGSPIMVIYDNDMGVGDMLTLLYLVKDETTQLHGVTQAQLDGVTIEGDGMAFLPNGVNNASRLLQVAGSPETPLSSKASPSLSPHGTFPKQWREEASSLYGIELMPNYNRPLDMTGPELMAKLTRESGEKVTILCTGPLTNVANFLLAYPGLKEKIDEIFIMGGAIDVPGNMVGQGPDFPEYSEYNIYLDAKAAAIVFQSGIPITLIPLDACFDVPVTGTILDRLHSKRNTKVADIAFTLLNTQYSQPGATPYFFDPLAAAIMTKEEIAHFEMKKIQVILEEGKDYGRTVESKNGTLMRVAMRAKASVFYDTFLGVITSP